MRVVIHADASPEIGTGHVVRSLSLAAALRESGAQVTLASDEMVDTVRPRVTTLGVELVRREGQALPADWVVFDGSHIDPSMRATLTPPGARALVIDDLGSDLEGATLALNQNLYATPAGPTRPGPEGELLAGPTYALLRPEFADLGPERQQPPVAQRVLVTMGGSDPNDATTAVVGSLSTRRQLAHVRVIIGAEHPSAASVERLAVGAGYEVVRDAPSLAPHLAWADMVISACGSTVLEVARAGRPMIGIVLAENQLRVADSVEREGIGAVAGSHPGLSRALFLRAFESMRADRESRIKAAAIGRITVDGRGASRVARTMETGPLRLRPATMDDGTLLLRWRNEPSVRDASFDSRPIDHRTHVAWLASQFASPAARIWIGMLDGVAIGAVRVALESSAATISVVLGADDRSRGIGTRLISMGCTRLAAEGSAYTVDAWIRPANAASLIAFRRAGFRPFGTGQEDRVLYRIVLDPMG